jgi:NH3-dependent NAD+ synthetase
MMNDLELTDGELLKAITVLSDEQQLQVLAQIKKDGGVTPEYGLQIARLLDDVIEAEGGMPQLQEERMELVAASASLAKQKRSVELPPQERGQQLEDELTEQQDLYDRWLSDVRSAESASAKRKEGRKQIEDRMAVEDYRRQLKGGQPSQN